MKWIQKDYAKTGGKDNELEDWINKEN